MVKPNLILTAGRVVLKPISGEDTDALWPYVSNPDISKDMSWSPHKVKSETTAFIENTLESMKEGKMITWCIFYESIFCGLFSLISILRRHRALIYDRAELAYWIGPEFEGKGIMSEAGQLVIEFAFKELKLHKLTVGHHLSNKRSQSLIERLGFRFSYLEQEVFQKDGRWISCKFYELNAKDYINNEHE